MDANKRKAAFETGKLSERLAEGYFAYVAAISVATDPRASSIIPNLLPGQNVPIGIIKNKNGTEHQFWFQHFLDKAKTDQVIVTQLEQIWFAGALLKLGDTLSQYDYFDRAPELELLRHLRNGVAHGNRFRIDNPLNLLKYPAHNKLAWVNTPGLFFEITPAVAGRHVLFDFMAPGDLTQLFQAISLYLIRMGNGDPLRP